MKNVYVAVSDEGEPAFVVDHGTKEVYRVMNLNVSEKHCARPVSTTIDVRPEDPLAALVPPASPQDEKPTEKKEVKKKTAVKYVKGTCGRCGKEGHSAWTCPDRKETKQKHADPKPGGKLCACGRPAGHTGRHIGSLAKNVIAPPTLKDMSEDRDEDAPIAPVLSCHICEEDHLTVDCPDFRSTITKMHETDGMDSLQIAAKLKIRISAVNFEE